jgi:uncharacterized protein (TIGR03437 family)
MRRFHALLGLCLAVAASLYGRQDQRSCGTHREIAAERLHLHRKARQARKAMAVREAAARPATSDVGQIVLVEDADGVVGRLNPFDLDLKRVVFTASAARYRFQTEVSGYDGAAAEAGVRLELDDDDSELVDLPFAFPFYGVSYRQVWVNSDGNLTFTAGDNASTERSLGRVTAGAPRIAGLFRDLDPTYSLFGVRLLSEAARVVVSWNKVPEYSDSGNGPIQTFQIRLYPDGRIEFAFSGITTTSAVVGISPGGLKGAGAVVSFSDGSSAEYASTVAERFSATSEIDVVVAAQKFYETHDDAYDFLVIANNLGIEAMDGAVAYEATVRTTRQGIGDRDVDAGREFGSASRLQAIINLGPLSQYPSDPYGIVPRRSLARDTPMSVIAHETGHLFLAYASIRDNASSRTKPMLCSDEAHWSFAFNAEASLVSGNRIRDNGAGVSPRFTTVATVESYSALDRYLMGLLPPEEVPATFLVKGALNATSCMPVPGVSFDGQRQDITVDQVIAAEGRRTPDHTVSQRRYRFAFLLVVAKGSEDTTAAVTQYERYRQEFETFFRRSTGELATAETSLKKSLKLSVFPASGVLLGSTATATLSVAAASAAPLAVNLKAARGTVGVPASVTIPAGAMRATFTVRGLSTGVEELTAEPADANFETATAYVQVTAQASDLTLSVVSGDRQLATPGVALAQPVVISVTDRNRLPYPGLTVRAAASGGGSVTPSTAMTGDNGQVSFLWTPGAGVTNELTATLDGAAPARATAYGRPAISSGGLVSAASFAAGLAPGGLASLFGVNLAAGASAQAASLPLPGELGGVRVLLDGQAAGLLYVSDTQINFYVPTGVAEGEVSVVVANSVGTSAAVRAIVAKTLPGLFFNPSNNLGAVIVRGAFLEAYATGLGPVEGSAATNLDYTVITPSAYIDGRTAEVLFSGLAPGFVGLYQVNLRLPVGIAAGTHTLVLESNGRRSNQVLFAVPTA